MKINPLIPMESNPFYPFMFAAKPTSFKWDSLTELQRKKKKILLRCNLGLHLNLLLYFYLQNENYEWMASLRIIYSCRN
jgi:hypothetical protein